MKRIQPVFTERVWGRTDLAPFWGEQPKRIGEVWFRDDGLPELLVKFIFTDERLSVQVHPADDYAREREGCLGKTEMWHILDARPGAQIAIGLREELSADEARTAIASGEILDLLNWLPVAPGDSVLIEAGVIHALGAGVTLCEIQQNSDITYRLFDYGRPRELHVDKGLEVAKLQPYEARRSLPVECACFRTERLLLQGSGVRDAGTRPEYLIALSGEGTVGGEAVGAGDVLLLQDSERAAWSAPGSLDLLRTYVP